MRKLLAISLLLAMAVLSPSRAADTIRLDLNAYIGEYPQDEQGKWTETYNADIPSMDFELFRFSHLSNASFSPATDKNGMPFWDGFTLCTSGDNTDYGMAGSSKGWLEHQWGCMAGGGVDADGTTVKGAPYLVAFWGYEYEEEGLHSLQVDFIDALTHRPLGIWVCNHPWPYYGIEHDDGFAHSFADNGSLFKLIVHGLDEEGKEAGMPVVVPLASFHDNSLDISDAWQWVDISSLGAVSAIYFTMESTDSSGALGMNTAAYFCLGGMTVLEHMDEIGRPSGMEAEAIDEHRINVSWYPVEDAAYYRVYVDSMLVDSTESCSYLFTDLETYTGYGFFAEAVSAQGEHSDWGYVAARTKDLTPPEAPGLLQAEPDMYKITLSWEAASDNIAVERYAVYVDGKRYVRTKYTSVTVTGLDAATSYLLELETIDTSGNISERVGIEVTTLSSPQNMEQTEAEETNRFYTMDGIPLTNKPAKGQVYIVRTNHNAHKQIQL